MGVLTAVSRVVYGRQQISLGPQTYRSAAVSNQKTYTMHQQH